MVAAEARASGVPLIVPDRGAAIDQLVPGAGKVYRAASEVSLKRTIGRFIDRGPELQRAAAARTSRVRTMDEHFAELFARYEILAQQRIVQPALADLAVADSAHELALARSALLGS
jgi:alpha-1,6-mannosyltransferase